MANPQVFITYSSRDPEHANLAVQFATSLRQQGINAMLHAWKEADELKRGEGTENWFSWMNRMLTKSEYVLAVCDRHFRDEVNCVSSDAQFEEGSAHSSSAGMNRTPSSYEEGRLLVRYLFQTGIKDHRLHPVIFCDSAGSILRREAELPDVRQSFSKDGDKYIPDVLGGYTYYVGDTKEGFEKLRKKILHQEEYLQHPPVASVVWRPPPPKVTQPLQFK